MIAVALLSLALAGEQEPVHGQLAASRMLTPPGETLPAPPPARAELVAAWRVYTKRFVSDDGRVIDPRTADATTSEGQAYGMLRAVWIGDRRRFDRMRAWTRNNLQGGDPTALSAWKWGRRGDGTWGVLDPSPASDADQLHAYALLLAADRWDAPELKATARGLLARIWDVEVTQAGQYRVVAPGPWALGLPELRVNPSYFLPFAWRAFAVVDPERPWARLVDDGYDVLAATLTPAGLPPDWAWLDVVTGAPVPPPAGQEALGHFGFEAFRVAWTLAAEARWHDEPRARALLARMGTLNKAWRETGAIPAVVQPTGEGAVGWSYLGLYGALVPAWDVAHGTDAGILYALEILPRRDGGAWGEPDDYYAQNWVWFGLALWSGVATPVPTP